MMTSLTPKSNQFDDIYFSPQDGLAETRHVFLAGNDLPARFMGRDRFTILETGFGTGLNFLAAWQSFNSVFFPLTRRASGATPSPHWGEGWGEGGETREGAIKVPFLNFISIEKYPLSKDEIQNYLSPWNNEFKIPMSSSAKAEDLVMSRDPPHARGMTGNKCGMTLLDRMLDQYPLRIPGFHRMVFENAALTLIFGDVNDVLPQIEARIDAWFLDGFKPSSNPEMWTNIVFENMTRLSAPDATFATFTAAGAVKRGLAAAGFEVHKIPGFGKKRDMLVGNLK